MGRSNLSYMLNLGFAANQPLCCRCDTSIKQSGFMIPNFPVISKDLNQSLPNEASSSVQLPDQPSTGSPSQPDFNEGVRYNEQIFNATFVSNQTPDSPTDQRLSNISGASYQQMANPFGIINQQTADSHFTQVMLNAAATHRGAIPTSIYVPTQPQCNQYQTAMSNTGRFI